MLYRILIGLLGALIAFDVAVANADDGLDCGSLVKTCFADGSDASCICVQPADYVPNPPEPDPHTVTDPAPADG